MCSGFAPTVRYCMAWGGVLRHDENAAHGGMDQAGQVMLWM